MVRQVVVNSEHLKNLDADKVLERFGKYGKYQMIIYMMASLNFFLFAYKTTIISLIGNPLEQCDNPSNNSSAQIPSIDPNGYNTLQTEFGIACEDSGMLEHASGAFMLGNCLTTPLATWLADRFGRRLTFLVPLWLTVLMSIACSLSPNYWLFLAFRFLSGACGAAVTVIGFVLTVECVAPSFRNVQALINSLVWVAGIFAVGILHLFVRNWRWLYLAMAVPGFFTLTYYWLFPESLHWLIANKKTREVSRYIVRSSRINKVTLNLHSCQSDFERQDEPVVGAKRTRRRGFLDLLRSPTLLFHLVLDCYIYVVMNFVYWVLTLYSINMHENEMVGFFLSATVEVPAGLLAMLLLLCMGRRTVSIITLFGQTVCLALTILFSQGSTPNLVFSLAAKVFNAVSWASVPLLMSEMAPTTVRNMMYGFVSTAGEIGSVLAPYLARIDGESTQKVTIASMSALAIVFAMAAPETNGRRMPQDLDDFDAGPFVRAVQNCFRRVRNRKTKSATQTNNCGEEEAIKTNKMAQQDEEQMIGK